MGDAHQDDIKSVIKWKVENAKKNKNEIKYEEKINKSTKHIKIRKFGVRDLRRSGGVIR